MDITIFHVHFALVTMLAPTLLDTSTAIRHNMLPMRTYDARHLGGPVPGVEATDFGPCLPEHRVIGCDGQVADQVQHVAAAHAVPRDLRHHRFGQPPYLNLRDQCTASNGPTTPQKEVQGTTLDPEACFSPPMSAVARCGRSDDRSSVALKVLRAALLLVSEAMSWSTNKCAKRLRTAANAECAGGPGSAPGSGVARLQVEHVEARHAVGADVAALSAHLLVAAAAERQWTLPCRQGSSRCKLSRATSAENLADIVGKGPGADL